MSDEQTTRVIEIQGTKFEVDLRTATRIDQFKVGDRIKVLKKRYEEYKSHPGVIVGFDAFKELPTIIVAYVDVEYSKASINFLYFNENSKDCELCGYSDDIALDKARVLEYLDAAINKAKEEVADLERKKRYFLTRFGQYFEQPAWAEEAK
jgi:hypothetical protein